MIKGIISVLLIAAVGFGLLTYPLPNIVKAVIGWLFIIVAVGGVLALIFWKDCTDYD